MAIKLISKMLPLIVTMALALANGQKIVNYTEVIELKELPHTSGFYYQFINKMQSVENLWTFVIEMDHGVIYKQLDSLYNETHAFINYINSNSISNCTSQKLIQTQLNQFVANQIIALVKKHNDLDSKISKSGEYADHPELSLSLPKILNRKRRGLLNFVGNVDKYLFGVMDNNDANLLHKVAQNENALNNQVKQLNDELISIANYEEHAQCINAQINDVCVYIDAKMQLLQSQLNEIDRLYLRLDRAVDDAMNNKINSMIMTPKRLLKELLNVTAHVPSKLTWPVPLKLDNMHHLIQNKIIKSHVFITKNRKLLFILEMPLINQQIFNVYQVVPIPFCSKGKCAVIVPESKYIGVSTNQHNYVRLDDEATKHCKVTVDNLLCYKPEIVYASSEALACDVRIFLDVKSTDTIDVNKDCDVRIGKFDDEIFYAISYYNQWLYILQKDTKLILDCVDIQIAPLWLKSGTGIISSKNSKYSCKIGTSKADLPLVQIKSSLYSVIELPITTSFNISWALSDIDKFEIDSLRSNSDLDHKNLKGMTERLIDLRKRMNNNTMFTGSEIAQSDDTSWFCWFAYLLNVPCHVAHSALITIVVVSMFLFVFCLFVCCCPRCCCDMWSCLCSELCFGLKSCFQCGSIVKVKNGAHYGGNNDDDDIEMDVTKVFLNK
jgi:hypothetical protein